MGRARIAHITLMIIFAVGDVSGSPMHSPHMMNMNMLNMNHIRRLSRVMYCIMVGTLLLELLLDK